MIHGLQGWRSISGKWYYFDTDGYMVKNKDIKGWYLDDNGVGTECINSDGLDVVKSTGTIVKFNPDPNQGPGKSSIPFDIPGKIDDIEIKSIGKEAFEDYWYIKSITIPEGVTSINSWMFFYCFGLKNVTIPSTVTTIKQAAFSNCKSLTNITIPNSVTNIEDAAFSDCSNLASVTSRIA